jgi:hypothetical protein
MVKINDKIIKITNFQSVTFHDSISMFLDILQYCIVEFRLLLNSELMKNFGVIHCPKSILISED